MNTYTIQVDKDQIELIAKALDFFSRIQLGQISELVNPYMVPLQKADYKLVTEQLTSLKSTMFPELPENAYYSIKSKKVPDNIRQIIDIYESIKYVLSEENDKKNLFHWSSEKELPQISRN